MNDHEKSDECVVPKKRPNKERAAARSAEGVEGRRSTKGNSVGGTKDRTQSRVTLQQNLHRVREAAVRFKEQQLTTLWHHCYNVDHLRAVFFRLKKSASPGVDGQTWADYAENLEDRLLDLSDRLRRGAYRAKPVLRTYIQKPDGRQRPLGIPTVEDKIVQGITKAVMEQVFEQEFLGFSYGSRPGRSPHGALDALAVGIDRKKVSWVLDADIRGFFDAIDHDRLIEFVEQRIADQRVLRHIKKWLNAGVLEDGKKTRAEYGTPQGGSISPLLANIYLHYVLDLWVAEWRRDEARGEMIVVRYVDDFVLGFQHEDDARRFCAALKERLAHFHLELHPDKTRLIEFGRFAAENRRRRGGEKTRNLRLPGVHSLLREDEAGQVQAGTQDAAEEESSETEEPQGTAPATDARPGPRDRCVAPTGASRTLPVLRRAGQQPGHGALPGRCDPPVVHDASAP